MKPTLIVAAALSVTVFLISCGTNPVGRSSAINDSEVVDLSASPSPTPDVQEDQEPEYEGKTIDQIFPIIEEHDFREAKFKDKTFDVAVAGYQLEISKYIPKFLKRGSNRLIRFQIEPGAYWSSLVGESHLLGPASRQIYVEATGPGGVCCTNYWIADVTFGRPKIIFRSQDFGSFRMPMEISDDDGDGIYELVQFDSCMRYFRDDCGSCSPEPRSYFKYDHRVKRYLPAKGIHQAFIKEEYAKTEKWIVSEHEKLKESHDNRLQYDLHRSLIAHVADLLHIGEERKAWRLFARFNDIVDTEDKKEIKKRLAQCKFYRSLHSKS